MPPTRVPTSGTQSRRFDAGPAWRVPTARAWGTDVNDTQLDALVAAADEGVDCDGLHVAETDAGYTFALPEETHEGLDESELRERATENPWFVS
ncbi:MAG: DUF7348 domain-containing protein, partial [Natronomonas sp.]